VTFQSVDRQLVDAVLGGDTAAFRVLVEREAPQVIAVCRRILRDPVEAEDVAQDSFIRAYRSLATYRGDGPFAAWISRIAARQALARLVARAETTPLDDLEATIDPRAEDDPEAFALADEQRDAIHAAVAALPGEQRRVVELRYFGDLSLDEIAATTHQPVGTVKSRLHRGIASLRGRVASGIEQ
jgi:RNA polymerase sigma-70 factor (ECF subfamily)